MNKSFLAILVVSIGLMVGLFVVAGGKEEAANSKFVGDPRTVVESDHTQGDADSAVTLIEYGDFECVACLSFFPESQQLKSDFEGDMRFVFRHLPLTTLHPNALAAHRASEAAANQDKFWEMHDLLYQTQSQWRAGQPANYDIGQATTFFEDLAGRLELDVEKFKTDFASQEVLDRINANSDSAKEFNATSTPTLVLNGEKIDRPPTAEGLKELIQEEVDKVKAEKKTQE